MASTNAVVGNNLRRGFELAIRLLGGEPCDVGTLQAELGVSRATAYRYHRFLADHAQRQAPASRSADRPDGTRRAWTGSNLPELSA